MLLVYANKQDLPDTMNPMEITEKLGLHDFRHHDWYVQGACATYGEGLESGISYPIYSGLVDASGLEWMTRILRKRF